MRDNKKVSGRVTSKGQVTIPIEVRKALNIEEGDSLEFVREESGSYAVQPVKRKSLRDVIGVLQTDKEIPEDFEEIREIAHRAAAEENMRIDLDEENRP